MEANAKSKSHPFFSKPYLGLGLLMAGSVALHFYGIHKRCIYLDGSALEILFVIQTSLSDIWFNIPWRDQSPLYFIPLKIWHSMLGVSATSMMSFGVPFQLINVFLVYQLSKVLFIRSKVTQLTSAALMLTSFHTYTLYHAGRMYPLQLVLTSSAILFLFLYLKNHKRKNLALFTGACVLNIYTHMFSFAIVGLLYLYFILSRAYDVFVARIKGAVEDRNNWKVWIPILLSGTFFLLCALPQMFRFLDLAYGDPIRSGSMSISQGFLSALGEILGYLAALPGWWDAPGYLRPAYWVCLALLFLRGVGLSNPKVRLFLFCWFFVGILMFAAVASDYDLRDRYFRFLLPVFFVVLANGAMLPSRAGILFGYGMKGIAIFVLGVALLGSLRESQNDGVAWFPLIKEIESYSSKEKAYYVIPNYKYSLPRLIGHREGFSESVKHTEGLGGAVDEFVSDVSAGKDVAILRFQNRSPDDFELARRLGSAGLTGEDYQTSTWHMNEVSADIYSQDSWMPYEEGRITGGMNANRILQWIKEQTSALSGKQSSGDILENAFAARIHPNGRTIQAKHYLRNPVKQKGRWLLGTEPWNRVSSDTNFEIRGHFKDVIYTHPLDNEIIAVSFPNTKLEESLTLTYGIADSGWRENRAYVICDIYFNDKVLGRIAAQDFEHWKKAHISTTEFSGMEGNLTLLLSTENQRGRHFVFRFDAFAQPKPDHASVIKLDAKRSLSDSLDKLTVERREDDIIVYKALSYYERPVSADVMHEREGPRGEGGIRDRWVIGEGPWEVVAQTKQRSGDVVKKGIWAHPKDDSTLVIRADNVNLKGALKGFYGFTDHAVEISRSRDIQSEVQFKVWLDHEKVIDDRVLRNSGWVPFYAVPKDPSLKSHTLRIEITASHETWAHFVFDASGQ